MNESVWESARATVLIGDFANADAGGKANVIGAGWQVTGLQPSGMTPPHSVVALIEVPARFYGEEFAISLTLCDEAGDPVRMPTPTGEPQAMRIQQLAKAERPNVPGVILPKGLPGRVQVIINFSNGLPLPAGNLYTWKLEIDGQGNDQWKSVFYIAGPRPGPVVG